MNKDSTASTQQGQQRRQVLRLSLAFGLTLGFASFTSPWLLPVAHALVLPPEVAASLPASKLQGSKRLTVWGFKVYDARLWAPAAPTAAEWARQPIALEMSYLRKLEGTAIAESSLKEMRRQGDIAPSIAQRWLAEMKTAFPDVAEGDRITGVHLPGESARFYFNGKLTGEVRDADFARLFFGIWLSPNTREPAMREALLGGAAAAPR